VISRIFVRAQLVVVAAAALAVAAPAIADEVEAEAAEETGFMSRFSGMVQSDFTNVYFFRGILQEKHGFIAQPWGELYFNAFASEEGPIRDVTFGAGVWASFHTKETLAVDGPHSLYETDWYPLLSISFAHNISLTTTYYWYTSPNGAFATAQELNFKLAWDDSETFGRWAMGPYVNFAVETRRTAFGPNEGSGVQMGIGPTLFTFFEGSEMPVTLSAPIELGLAIDDYYEEEDGDENTFGYLNFGLSASVPLAFMPVGDWSFTLTAKGWYLSNTLREVAGHTVYPQVIGSIGVEF
jgi:hypothetical protein